MTAMDGGPSVVWAPLPGSQTLFLTCPIYEVLYEGTRGPGKTDALLMDFAQHCGQGYGRHWRGILFRQTYKQLDEIVTKSKRWFHRIFPQARFLESKDAYKWVWPDKEELLFRHMKTPADYWDYHGHEYPWVGFDELTNWPSLECYHLMKSCNRSSHPTLPRKYRGTANPYGPGHNTVKAYFVDPAPPGVPVTGEEGLKRVRIRGHWSENTILLAAEPDYPKRIMAAATNPEQAKAWLEGDWDIVSGGMFDDLWSRPKHILKPFPIPESWRIDRAYDWGLSKPFSYGCWGESDGTTPVRKDGTAVTDGPGKVLIFPRGSLIYVAEWYGWDGKNPNVGLRMTDPDIAQGIVEREERWGWRKRTKAGPADASIFNKDAEEKSIAAVMAKHGVRFTPSDKSPGSRKQGWAGIRRMLQASLEERPEEPGIWVFDTCRQAIRTLPTLPRSEKDPDDVDTDAEDHIADQWRYRVLETRTTASSFKFKVV